MNPIKRVLGHLYFVYALLVFFITMLPVLFIVLIALACQEPTRAKIIHPTYRIWMEVYLHLIFCHVKRSGTQFFQNGQNYVVVLNHNSLADIPVSTPWIPGPNKTLAKIEMAKIPLFGLIYRAGSILLDRKNEKSRMESTHKMKETLEMGIHLALFPEGTRNKTDKPLQTFQDGAFMTAILVQKPIMPAVLSGTKDLLPNKPTAWAWPQLLKIEFLPPFDTKGLEQKDRKALKQEVFEAMEAHILQQKH